MTKKVIFVSGTSRSGSTLLDNIVANDKKAMSLGEIHALFHPVSKHHHALKEKLNNDQRWSKIVRKKKKNLYTNIIEAFPEYDFFIDSSKDPFWVAYHTKKLKKQNVEIYNILIYKSINEIANSFIKRGLNSSWGKIYINHHKMYATLVSNAYVISYFNLINNKESLKYLCTYLDIPFFSDKRKYWHKESTSFFGSSTVNKHAGTNDGKRRDVTYDEPDLTLITKNVEAISLAHPEINKIEQALDELQDRSSNLYTINKFGRLKVISKIIKRSVRKTYLNFFPEDYQVK